MYNATATKLAADGRIVSREAVELDAEGRVLRACGLWSHLNGTPEYEAAWRSAQFSMVAEIVIEQDGAKGYRDALGGLGLPPAYKDGGAR